MNFDPKMVPQVHHSFVTSDRQIIIQAPRRTDFLLREYSLRSHTKLQVARVPKKRV